MGAHATALRAAGADVADRSRAAVGAAPGVRLIRIAEVDSRHRERGARPSLALAQGVRTPAYDTLVARLLSASSVPCRSEPTAS